MKKLILFFILYPSLQLTAQHRIDIAGISFSYKIIGDSIQCFLSAPTHGWLLVGFNNKNSIEGADLKFFAPNPSGLNYSDRKNIGGRNYPSDLSLGGQENISIYSSKETPSSSFVWFSIPFITNDRNDWQHSINEAFWLILAYSTEDDFQHHSSVRKHLPFKWEP